MQRLPIHTNPWWQELRNLHLTSEHHNLMREIMLHLEALKEMQPSSPATTPLEDSQSGGSTGSITYSLAKEGLTGRLQITATDTSAGRSLIQALGDELKYSQDGIWTLTEQSTLESQWHFGRLLSTPEAAPDGPSASTSEASE